MQSNNRYCQNDTIENYAMDMTSTPSGDMKEIAKATQDNEMFAPCMVGTLESQFLKMIVQMCGAKKVLDVGTFTGKKPILDLAMLNFLRYQ